MENTQEISSKALSIIDQGKLVIIKIADDYKKAGELWITIKGIMKQVDESFDPIISKARAAHKEAVAQKAKIYDPLKAVYVSVKQLMSKYDEAQKEIARKEAARLAEIARKAEEERLLQEAILAEEAGDKEESAAILQEPVYVPPITVQKATPKLNGGPIYREVTKFEIVEEALIPRIYLIPDMVKIGGVVRALKQEANIPGVRVYTERC